LDEKFQKFTLNENFRNTQSIFSCFHALAQQNNLLALGPHGNAPEFIIVKNYELQFTWIADKIKKLISSENIQLRETGVVLYDGLKETNIKNLSKVIPSITGHQHTNAEYVEPDQIMMDTVNRIKGLEVPVMFLTNFINPLEQAKLYVSLSRAKHRLFIVGLESKIIELKKCLGLAVE
jgi:superfamily I DNA/RNA helicase